MNLESMGERTVRARLVDIVESHQNVKLIAIVIAFVACLAVYFFSAKTQKVNQRLADQRVVLQDAAGKMVAFVEIGESGPRIRLFRVLFEADERKAVLTMKDEKGERRLTLAGGQTDPVLSILSSGGKPSLLKFANMGPDFGLHGFSSRLSLRPFEQEGKSGLKIIDGENRPVIVLETGPEGIFLSILDQEGNTNTRVQSGVSGLSLSLMDTHQRIRGQALVADEKVELTFLDSLGRKRAELSTGETGDELLLFDDTQVAREAIILGEMATSLKIIDDDPPPPALVSAENSVLEL